MLPGIMYGIVIIRYEDPRIAIQWNIKALKPVPSTADRYYSLEAAICCWAERIVKRSFILQ